MAPPKKDEEPRYIWLKKELTKIIIEEKLVAHDIFLSQPNIIKTFKVTITTARKALDDMEKEGLIYRIHGKGTYVAPKSQTHSILIVSNYNAQIRERHFAYMRFMAGIMDYLDEEDHHYYPCSINSEKFLEKLEHLELYYRDIKGVIFFRDMKGYSQGKKILEEKGIPFYFYGSDTYCDEVDSPSIMHEEKQVVLTGIEKILEKKYQAMGIYFNDNNPVRKKRYDDFLAILQEKSLPLLKENLLSQKDFPRDELIKKLSGIKERTAFFCVDDWLGTELVNCAVLAGKKVPEEIGIIGVNDFPFCSLLITPLSSISIPLFEDARICFENMIRMIEGEKELEGKNEIKVVERASL
ncbi:MAG: substrate-binding domain-containing protein [Spirochaetales bacterium]|nr:substrate-binding domain-containing protein [Spirochaetales bacterium]